MHTPSSTSPLTVVVVGASEGIGRATALRFARRNARVVLAARGLAKLEDTAQAVRAAGGEPIIVQTDISDLKACANLIDTAIERTGRIDVLINNAALHHRGEFKEHDAFKFASMIDVNVRAPIFLTRYALPHLEASKGCVIQVASLAGCVPLPGAVVYSSSKFAMRTFSLALHEELRGGPVRFCVVSPGPVSTGFILNDLEHVSDASLAQPMSTADDIADLIIACADDGQPERKSPAISGTLATLAYLFPQVGRALRPIMRWRGGRVRRKLSKQQPST